MTIATGNVAGEGRTGGDGRKDELNCRKRTEVGGNCGDGYAKKHFPGRGNDGEMTGK